jgi:hypothetical protein
LLAEHAGQYVHGDNGYGGARFREAVSADGPQVLASPRPSQRPVTQAADRAQRWLRAKRDMIETVFAVLADHLTTLETIQARSVRGVMTRLAAKLLVFNLSIESNRQFGRPSLAIKEIYL